MTRPFGLAVRFTLREGAEEAFDRLVEETVSEIQKHEPGTLVYTCHAVEGHPNQRIFYELYRDHDAFEEHERQLHTRRFLEQRSQYVAELEVDQLHLLTGKERYRDDQ